MLFVNPDASDRRLSSGVVALQCFQEPDVEVDVTIDAGQREVIVRAKNVQSKAARVLGKAVGIRRQSLGEEQEQTIGHVRMSDDINQRTHPSVLSIHIGVSTNHDAADELVLLLNITGLIADNHHGNVVVPRDLVGDRTYGSRGADHQGRSGVIEEPQALEGIVDFLDARILSGEDCAVHINVNTFAGGSQVGAVHRGL